MRNLQIKLKIAIQLGIVLMACIGTARSMAQSTIEGDASAAFLLNFLKFAHFPPSHIFEPSGKIRIFCVGEDPVFSALHRLESRTNSQIEVRLTPKLPATDGFELVLIGQSEKGRLGSILSRLEHSSVYTASSIQGFAKVGGMLEFGYSTNRINYQLNMDEIRGHQLTVSSRFLKLGDGNKEKTP